MSKAFYPTNDGHVGNLRNLSTLEIRDLLKRQDDLLQKKQKLLSKLPDKGARIKKHLEELQQELTRRETAESFENPTKLDNHRQSAQNESLHTDIETDKSDSKETKLKALKEKERTEGSLDDTKNLTTKSLNGNKEAERSLEKELLKLSVKDNDDVKKKSANDSETAGKVKHQYELALERAEQNVQSGLKQPMKLNRFLKVEHVKDLPEDILKMKDTMIDVNKQQSRSKMETNKAIEESSAVPPNYKFSQAKVIDINESLKLQQQQKQIQEELHAEMAAEKLAKRLHIKTEPYNPGGVDMSYRAKENVEDSDDDDAEDIESAGYSMTMVPSDTED